MNVNEDLFLKSEDARHYMSFIKPVIETGVNSKEHIDGFVKWMKAYYDVITHIFSMTPNPNKENLEQWAMRHYHYWLFNQYLKELRNEIESMIDSLE